MIPLLWILVSLLAIILAAGLGLSFYFTKRGRLGETHTPAEYGLKFETIEFKTSDHLALRGVWIPAEGSDRAVIILHGHGSSYDFDIYRAPSLVKAGFNVLLFDFRAHGRSEGKRATFGYEERRDMLAAIEFLHGRGIRHIGLMGFSYGGIVSMVFTAEYHGIEAVVTDGGPARIRKSIAARGVEMGLPKWLTKPASWLIILMTSVRLGANQFKYEPLKRVGRISPTPILFIHGDHDQYLPDFDELWAAANQPKELWRLPEFGHCEASLYFPEEHTRRVVEFFTRHMPHP